MYCDLINLLVKFLRSKVVAYRKTREAWPLLTVETEANGDSRRTYERGPNDGLVVSVKDIFVLPWLL
jgi:hypothetical protein